MHLDVDGLRVSRGERTVLDRLSFRVASGEALLLTGPNGVGKSTLLRCIAGLIRPDAGACTLTGSAEVDGMHVFAADVDASVGEQCHFIGHLNAVKPSLTAAENLAFWGAMLAGNDVRHERRALGRLGLEGLADVPAGYLSAGQKRRLGLARLLVAKRPLWLLDEPTVSLDAASVATFAGIVAEHLAGGGIAIAATHVPLGLAGARELQLGRRAEAA